VDRAPLFPERLSNLVHRLPALPSLPEFLLLRGRESLSSPSRHLHHLLGYELKQKMLHRPTEPTWVIGHCRKCAFFFRFSNVPLPSDSDRTLHSLQRIERGGVLEHWMREVTPPERTTQAELVAPLMARSRSEAMLVRQARPPPNSIHTSHSIWASFISAMTSTKKKTAARTTPATTRTIRRRYPFRRAATSSAAGTLPKTNPGSGPGNPSGSEAA